MIMEEIQQFDPESYGEEVGNVVVIVGAPRSGTTLLGKTLAQFSSVFYLDEATALWRVGNASLRTDVLDESHASPFVVSHIRQALCSKVAAAGKTILLEKTPANSLRPRYLKQVLPSAKYIHIVRDGREVIPSARKKWLHEIDNNRHLYGKKSHKLRHLRIQFRKARDIPRHELRYYMRDMLESALFFSGLRTRKIWGPRFLGIEQAVEEYEPIEVCAMQWQSCVQSIIRNKRYLGEQSVLELRYEDLCRDPERVIGRVVDFLDWSWTADLEAATARIRSNSNSNWVTELTEDERARVIDIIAATLTELGYH